MRGEELIQFDKKDHKIFRWACFERIYLIDRQLKEGKYPSIVRLAERLEVKPRTIERDIEHMRDRLGACIAYDRRRKGYYYTANGFQLPPLHLTESETTALFLGQKLLIQCAGTPFEGIIRSAFEKIRAQLPSEILLDYSAVDRTVSFDVIPLRGDDKELAGNFSRLTEAITNKTTIWMEYYSASRDQTTQREVDPYHLKYFQGAWYLIGYCYLRNGIRIFALDRMLDLKETKKLFTPLPNFSLPEFLSGSMGIEAGSASEEVKIRFDNYQARFIRERRWHESQRLEDQNDGSLIVHLKVSGLGEVKRWVLSFGCHAEVLSPESLREQVKEEIRRAVVIYGH